MEVEGGRFLVRYRSLHGRAKQQSVTLLGRITVTGLLVVEKIIMYEMHFPWTPKKINHSSYSKNFIRYYQEAPASFHWHNRKPDAHF